MSSNPAHQAQQRFFINENAKITEENAIPEQLKYLILVGFRKPDIAIAYNDETIMILQITSRNEHKIMIASSP